MLISTNQWKLWESIHTVIPYMLIIIFKKKKVFKNK